MDEEQNYRRVCTNSKKWSVVVIIIIIIIIPIDQSPV
jgi:hypothetical protein